MTATFYCGDALHLLPTYVPDGSIQTVITSPPYFGLRDYNTPGQIGLEPTPAEFVEALTKRLTVVRDALARDGTMWLVIGDSYSVGRASRHNTNAPNLNRDGSRDSKVDDFGGARFRPKPETHGIPTKNLLGIPWRAAFALQDSGWILRNAIVWHKPNAMPESVTDRLSCRYEQVFLFSKSRKYWFDLDPIREVFVTKATGHTFGGAVKAQQLSEGSYARRTGGQYVRGDATGRNPGDVWSISNQPYKGAHFAVFPPELVRRCMQASSREGDTVLDPFCGSGTVAQVATHLNRDSVNIDINPDYLGLARERQSKPPRFPKRSTP